MTLQSVPVIDIEPLRSGSEADKRALAQAVDRACQDIGFLVISGHGVPSSVIKATEEVSRQFFDLPLAAKLRVGRPSPDISRGYVGLEGETVARSRDGGASVGDLNESFIVGPMEIPDPAYAYAPEAGNHFAPNLWPSELPEMPTIFHQYYKAVDSVAVDLMRIFALGLGLPEPYFDHCIDRTISRIRVRNYPAPLQTPQPGQLRAGAHSDYGSLTSCWPRTVPAGSRSAQRTGRGSTLG